MRWRGRIGHHAAILIAVPLAFELLFLGWLFIKLQKAEESTGNGLKAEKILQHAQLLSTSLVNSFVAVANFGFYKSDRAEADKKFALNREAMVKEMVTFKHLLAEDHRFDSRLSELDEFISRAQTDLETTRELFEEGKEEEALFKSLNWRKNVGSYYSILADVTRKYRQIKEDDERVQPGMETSLLGTLCGGVAVSIGVALCLAYLVSNNVLRDLACLTDNLERLNKRQPLLPPPSGTDEITDLNKYLCRTADVLIETERQLTFSRARWDAILASSPDGIVGTDSSNRILFSNQKVTDLTGWSSAELIESDISKLLPTISSDSESSVLETFARRANDQHLPVEVRVSSSAENQIVSIKDIQQRHAVKLAKKEFSDKLRADLESPLNFIQSTCREVADLADISEAGKSKLRETTTSCSRLLTLITQLDKADVACAETYVAHRKLVNIHDLLSTCLTTMQDFATNARVTLSCSKLENASKPESDTKPENASKPEGDTKPENASKAGSAAFQAASGSTEFVPNHDSLKANLDESSFSRVITNLLSNAIKFSPPNSEVWLLWSTQSTDLEILVRDTGRGIPKDKISTLFDRFSQVADDDRKIGSGLGLAICRQIIEAHGGTIDVESVEGQGTTFRLVIPNCVEVT